MDIRKFINKINLLNESVNKSVNKSTNKSTPKKSVKKEKTEFNVMVERSKDFINEFKHDKPRSVLNVILEMGNKKNTTKSNSKPQKKSITKKVISEGYDDEGYADRTRAYLTSIGMDPMFERYLTVIMTAEGESENRNGHPDTWYPGTAAEFELEPIGPEGEEYLGDILDLEHKMEKGDYDDLMHEIHYVLEVKYEYDKQDHDGGY